MQVLYDPSIYDKKTKTEEEKAAEQKSQYAAAISMLSDDVVNGKTAEARLLAQQALEAIQKSYGTFSYDREADYNQLLEAVTNPAKFSYDYVSDPTYSATKKAYLREGDRAMKNALAQTAAATGGVPSSWAVSAAQQAQNYYGSALSDKISALEENAYQRYVSEINNNINALSVLDADRQSKLSEWQTQQQAVADAAEALAESQAAETEAAQQQFENALKLYDTTGTLTTGLGLTQAQINQILGVADGTTAAASGSYDYSSIEDVRVALGLPSLTAQMLNDLIQSGQVRETVGADGKIRYEVITK